MEMTMSQTAVLSMVDLSPFENMFSYNAQYGIGYTDSLRYIMKSNNVEPAADVIRLFLTSWHRGFEVPGAAPCPPAPSKIGLISLLGTSSASADLFVDLPMTAIVSRTRDRPTDYWLSAMKRLQETASEIFPTQNVIWSLEPTRYHGFPEADWLIAYDILQGAQDHDRIARKTLYSQDQTSYAEH